MAKHASRNENRENSGKRNCGKFELSAHLQSLLALKANRSDSMTSGSFFSNAPDSGGMTLPVPGSPFSNSGRSSMMAALTAFRLLAQAGPHPARSALPSPKQVWEKGEVT